jgi:hypothetical protein
MFARLATPIFPIMDNMYLETFWFYVPNRLVWDNFVKQHGEQTNPGDSTDFTTPVIDSTTIVANATTGSLWDNFGLPMKTGLGSLNKISALPFRMYNLIYNDWFRDQDLINSLDVSKDNGPDSLADYAVKRVARFKDYFNTARPAPQKGPAVDVPIGGTAPVTGHAEVWGANTADATSNTNNRSPIFSSFLDRTTDGVLTGPLSNYMPTGAAPVTGVSSTASNANVAWATGSATGSGNVTNGFANMAFEDRARSVAFRAGATAPFAVDTTNNNTLSADLSAATGPTINAFREAVTIQQVYELDMRGGTRFIEMIFNHFGVINPDFRLQRPEFLGYQRSMVNIHPVAQTGETATTPQGNLSAFGTVSSHGNGFVKGFTEHGYVMGLMVVRADVSYQEGVDRHWSRQTRFDYYYPSFANLGEQAILNQELQIHDAGTDNESVFGYQEAWAEYRYKTSKITGLFRSSNATSLDSWHLAPEFAAVPGLNQAFIEENAPVDRCIAVSDEPHFIFDSLVENISARVMPVYSAPGLMRI